MTKLLRILGWLTVSALLLIILAAVALKLFFPAEKAKELVMSRGSEALGRELSVDAVNLSLWGGLGLQLTGVNVAGVTDEDSVSLLSAHSIDVKLRMLPLIFGEFRVEHLIVENPAINLTIDSRGNSNFEFGVVEQVAGNIPSGAKTAAAVISFDELTIENGSLRYVDQQSNVTLEVKGLQMSSSLQTPRPGLLRSIGEIRIDSLDIAMGLPFPTVRIELDYRLAYDIATGRLAIEDAALALNELRFDLSGHVENLPDSPLANIIIKSTPISAKQLFSLLPSANRSQLEQYRIDGEVSSNIEIRYDSGDPERPLYYSGNIEVRNLSMSADVVPGTLKVERILADIERDRLKLSIENGSFDGRPLKGHLAVVDFSNPRITGNLAGDIDLSLLQPFLPPQSHHQPAGLASFEVTFDGPVAEPMEMAYSGRLRIERGSYAADFLPQPIDSFALDMYMDRNVVRFDMLKADFESSSLMFTGRMTNLIAWLVADSVSRPQMEAQVDGHLTGQIDMSMIPSFLPGENSPELSGRMDIDVALTGELSNPEKVRPRGRVQIHDATYADSELPEAVKSLNAELLISPDSITVKSLRVELESSDFQLTGRFLDPFPFLLLFDGIDRSQGKRPLLLFELKSTRFNVDRLFPAAVPGGAAQTVLYDSIIFFPLPDIDGRGRFYFDTLIYSAVEFTRVGGKVRISGRKIECYDVTAKVYSGSASGRTVIDLSDPANPHYVGEFNATRVETDDFLSRFSPFAGVLFGKIDLTGDYDARGWDRAAFLNSLKMDGTGTISDGELVTSGAVYDMFKGLAEKSGQEFTPRQKLRDMKGKFLISNGRVQLDELVTSLGKIGKLKLAGSYGFDGSLSYDGLLELSSEMTQKLVGGRLAGGLATLLGGGKSTPLHLPFTATGTFAKPELSLDYTAIARNAGEGLLQKGKNLLRQRLKNDPK